MLRKIQRIDFSASDWLAGTATLSFAERGMYITVCALIYVAGGPITKADLRKISPGRAETFNAVLLRLVDLGKITSREGIIDQVRCERELARARRRIDGDESDSSPIRGPIRVRSVVRFESDPSLPVSSDVNKIEPPLRARNPTNPPIKNPPQTPQGGISRQVRGKAEAAIAELPWEARCRSWATGHRWDARWGPPPDDPHCHAPPGLIAGAVQRRKMNGFAAP